MLHFKYIYIDMAEDKQKLIADMLKNSAEIENIRTLFKKSYAKDNSKEW